MDTAPDRAPAIVDRRNGGQADVIAWLADPAAHGGGRVERIETHASIVFLAGERAYKLKRAVRYDYLDYSTLERRRACCEAELRINRAAAPSLYRRVIPVTREIEGHLALDGAGIPIEWVVEMVRFDQDALLDRMAARGTLDLSLMRPLGAALAQFHAAAARRVDHGGADGMRWVSDGNAAALQSSGVLDPGLCASVVSASRYALDRSVPLLDERRAQGFVRECHGDVHLGNVVLLDGAPTLFDAIEFNDELACIDVFYDLAFLLMDLWRQRLRRHANVVLNGYLARVADFDGLALLPLFLSARAAIRAKTNLAAAALTTDIPGRRQHLDAARDYLVAGAHMLVPARPSLIAVGGLSGSGKSTLAAALAPSVGPVPGAVVLRSDEIRKRLCGVTELTRLGPGGYTAEVSRAVYDTLASHAAAVVRAGHTAVVDAVFMNPAQRNAVEHAARAAKVPFIGLWLDAPAAVLVERLERRSADASDADPAVVRMQCARDAGAISWDRIDATADPAAVLDVVLRLIRSNICDGVRLAA